MFTTDDTGALGALLDRFQVPMFVADCDVDGQYHMVTINRCHSRASTMRRSDIQNANLRDILPDSEAAAVNEKYRQCNQTGLASEYEETLTINGKRTRWHTTLLPTYSQSGRRRVVGNAVLVEAQTDRTEPDAVFEDINYFSVQSQFQLSRVSSYLDALGSKPGSGLATNDLTILSGLCRTVERTLNDIRVIAEPRRAKASGVDPTFLFVDRQEGGTACRRTRDPVRKSLQRLSKLLDVMH